MDPLNSKLVQLDHRQNQIMSFKISEKQWDNGVDTICLDVNQAIPDMLKIEGLRARCMIRKNFVGVSVPLPLHLKEKVKVKVKCNFKSSDGDDGEVVGTVNIDERSRHMVFVNGTNSAVYDNEAVRFNPKKLYGKERSFIFEVDVLIEVEDSIKSPEVMSDLMELYSLGKDIKTINKDDENSDFIIRVDGKEFKCHKIILSARSNYFKGMLSGDYLETKTNSVDVHEDIPAKTIEHVLNYIYTGEIPNENNLDVFLLHAADIYLLDELKEACVKYLLGSLDVTTCLATFVTVSKYYPVTSPARRELLKFMICKAAEVVELDECAELIKDYPDLTRELLKALGKMGKGKHCCKYCLITYEN